MQSVPVRCHLGLAKGTPEPVEPMDAKVVSVYVTGCLENGFPDQATARDWFRAKGEAGCGTESTGSVPGGGSGNGRRDGWAM